MTRIKPPILKRRRKRARPIQVYVSATEYRELARIAERRKVTVSALVRQWIKRAAAAANGRDAPRRAAAADDPRQLRLA